MRIALCVLLALVSTVGYSQANFKFEKKSLRFEKVKPGPVLEFDFSFSNAGNQPLLISEITVSCPCTTADHPKHPILPGESGTIHVTFDTKGKIGYQDRTLTIFSNAKTNPEKIRFKGMVDHKQQ